MSTLINTSSQTAEQLHLALRWPRVYTANMYLQSYIDENCLPPSWAARSLSRVYGNVL